MLSHWEETTTYFLLQTIAMPNVLSVLCFHLPFFFDVKGHKVLEIDRFDFYCSVYEIKYIDLFVSNTNNFVRLYSHLSIFKFAIMI